MNFQQIMNVMNQFKNPQQMLSRMGIPQEYMDTPQSVAQYLLDNGKVTQEQINQANTMYQQFFRR